MTVDVNQNLASSNIPNDNLVVRPGGQENIESGRMPQHEANAALMVEQVDDRLGDGSRQSAVRNLPHLDVNIPIIINSSMICVLRSRKIFRSVINSPSRRNPPSPKQLHCHYGDTMQCRERGLCGHPRAGDQLRFGRPENWVTKI